MRGREWGMMKRKKEKREKEGREAVGKRDRWDGEGGVERYISWKEKKRLLENWGKRERDRGRRWRDKPTETHWGKALTLAMAASQMEWINIGQGSHVTYWVRERWKGVWESEREKDKHPRPKTAPSPDCTESEAMMSGSHFYRWWLTVLVCKWCPKGQNISVICF